MKQKIYVALVRTLRTFVAAALAQLLVTNNPYSENALLAATMAGLVAVWNIGTSK